MFMCRDCETEQILMFTLDVERAIYFCKSHEEKKIEIVVFFS